MNQDDKIKNLRIALRQAFCLGEKYADQGNSESISVNNRAAKTQADFERHIDNTVADFFPDADGADEESYQQIIAAMANTLAKIDAMLGINDDGEAGPDATLEAIEELKALAARSMPAKGVSDEVRTALNRVDAVIGGECYEILARALLAGSSHAKAEESRVKQLEAALRSVNAVAIERGDKYGACDQIDNDGQPYQSQWLADLLAAAPLPKEGKK